MRERRLPWFCFSLLIACLSLVLYSRHANAPVLANDSYQYLDAASHVASGACLCTTVAHFDEQVGWKHMPIPFTHFGPAYPLLIALLQIFGIPGEIAGYLLSAAGYLLVICFFWLLGRTLALPPFTVFLICLVWSFSFLALDFAVAVGTDSLFAALLTGLILLLALDLNDLSRPRPSLLFGLGVLVGFAFWLRQAGLFLLPPLLLYLAWRWWRQPTATPYVMIAGAFAVLPVASLISRNLYYVHSWNSGFANGRHAAWQTVMRESAKVPYHELFGTQARAELNLPAILFFLSLAVLAWRLLARRPYPNSSQPFPRLTVFWLLIFAAAFACATLLAELKTIVADYVRYDFPLLPVALILAALFFRHGRDTVARAAACLCVVAVVAINAESLFAPRHENMNTLPADLLAQPIAPGLSMAGWIEKSVPKNAVFFATEGQAVHYLIHRPVVALIEPQYTVHSWDEGDLHRSMQAFRARYLLVFPGASKERAPEQYALPFLAALARGQSPAWLQPVERTPGVILYRCEDCQPPFGQAH